MTLKQNGPKQYGTVTQSAEFLTFNQGVVGSNPTGPTLDV